jgi:hypothetical protein
MRQDLTLCTENYYQINAKIAQNIIYDFLLLCSSNLKGKFRICDFFISSDTADVLREFSCFDLELRGDLQV